MPLVLGYVDVWTGISSSAPKLRTFPLAVVVAVPPLNEPPPANDLAFLATNPIDLDAPPAEVLVGAMVSRDDETGQEIELIVAPAPTLVDAEVVLRVNTTRLTTDVDYAARPSPKRGESFVVLGTRFRGTAGMPVLRAVLGVTKGAQPSRPRDVTGIRIGGVFDQPREVIVGQLRQRTEAAKFTGSGTSYRRAGAFGFDGLVLDVTLHDPTATGERWVNVDLTAPRAEDGPVRPVLPTEGGPAPPPDPSDPGNGIQTHGSRQYQVTWVQAHGNETAASPPSPPASTQHGKILVPLPVWTDPLTPTPTGVRTPEPPTRRRVYRTVSTTSGTAGEMYLVKEIANATDAFFLDDRGDDQLGEPLLSDLTVRYRETLDRAGAQLATGFASMRGVLVQSSYEETAGGDPQFRGTVYDIDLRATPPAADVVFTTRPAAGQPRLTWSSRTATGPAGIGSASVALLPFGVAVGSSQAIRAAAQATPADLAADWSVRGDSRVRVEIGRRDDPAKPLDTGIGLVVLRAALADDRLQTPSARTADIDLTPARTALTARGLRRLRLLLGLPHPTQPGNAVLDDGIVAEVEVAPRNDGRPRSLRVLREALDRDGKRERLMLRVGDLPDALTVDARPGHEFAPTKVGVRGRLHRLMVLVQSAAELAGEDVSQHRRRDGLWLTVPDLGDRFDLAIDGDVITAVPAAPLRADLSLRSSEGLGSTTPKLHQVQASITVGGRVELRTPDGGQTVLGIAGGASGRASVSSRPVGKHVADRLIAVRATPQVRAMLRQDGDDLRVDDATLRVLGLTGFVLPPESELGTHVVGLTPSRANLAFRGHALLTDTRVQAGPWDLVRARIADLPESVKLTFETGIERYRLVLNRRSGVVAVFAQPALVPSSGVATKQLVGVGLATAIFDGLPTDLQIDVLGGANDFRSAPFNATPDADWRRSGFRIRVDGEMVARALQIISVAMVRPPTLRVSPPPGAVPRTAFWSSVAASLVRVRSENAGAPGAVWIWTPAEPLPNSSWAESWEGLGQWLGYRIESPALVTLQVQAYEAKSEAIPRWWHGGFPWLLGAELQMQDYRGEVTVDADLSPEGDDDAGPGKWYLRIPDGAPLGGQVVFGNTGGWISNRPRIFAPFTPEF